MKKLLSGKHSLTVSRSSCRQCCLSHRAVSVKGFSWCFPSRYASAVTLLPTRIVKLLLQDLFKGRTLIAKSIFVHHKNQLLNLWSTSNTSNASNASNTSKWLCHQELIHMIFNNFTHNVMRRPSCFGSWEPSSSRTSERAAKDIPRVCKACSRDDCQVAIFWPIRIRYWRLREAKG